MKKIVLFFIICLHPLMVFSQDIPIGTWRTHLTYHTAQQVVVAKEKVYCASENGLFYLNTSDNSLQTITKIDGLSDNGISDLAYSEAQDYLIIAYSNGNIDIIGEDEIINVRTILNSNRPNKNIHQVTLRGNLAVFATDFGGVELDLNSLTIKDVYENIGGSTSIAYSSATTDDSVYLATSLGVYAASLAPGVNRQDFANWNLLPATQGQNIQHIAVLQNQLYYGIPNDSVYRYENGERFGLTVATRAPIENLVATTDRLYIITGTALFEVQASGTALQLTDDLITNPMDVSAAGQLWVADQQAGLVRYESGNSQNFFPTGTLSANAFRLQHYNNNILAVSGGFSRTLQPENNAAAFYVFDGTNWQNFTSESNLIGASTIPAKADLAAAVYDAANQKIYLASFGAGVLAWNLSDDSFTDLATGPQQITDLALDSKGILWATAISPNGLYQYDGTAWTLAASPSLPLSLLIDEFDNKWVIQSNGGVFVFDEEQNRQRTLGHAEGNGNLRGNRAFSMVRDLEGSIWVGTDDGLTEFFDPFSIFNGTNGNFVRDIEGNVIMKDETTTALAVDGGNRKWIGTLSSGLWLYDDGGELLANFNTENSPLLANEIKSISIQPTTGEVFIATSQGIVSYRSTATQGQAFHSTAKVFPNPVEANFSGLVSITGLVREADVRITDVLGRLVWKGQSQGGTATWNAADFNGQRVQTGVYLVFSSTRDGEDSLVAKIAILQ